MQLAEEKKTKSFSCAICSSQKESVRLPVGWKLVPSGCVCKSCKSTSYIQLVVSLPIEEIITDEKGVKPWTPFKKAWDLATSLVNWCQIELLKHDAIRDPSMKALPKFNRKMFPGGRDLYGHWNANCPFRGEFIGAAGSASTILRSVEQRWSKHKEFGRFAVLWRRDSASPVARWPQPWVVRSQDYKLELISGVPHVSMTVPGGRVTVRLKSDSDWRRDVRRFESIVRGEASGGDLKIMAKFRDGKLVGAMLRLSAMFESNPQDQDELIVADIKTSSENLLEIRIPGRETFVFCGDDLVGKQAAYDRWRHRAAVDLKHEKRWPKRKRRRMVLSNQQAAINAQNRVKTGIEQIVSMVVGHEDKRHGRIVSGYLTRNRVSSVVYDDSCKEFIHRFEWHALREKMRQRCAELGIRFLHSDCEQPGDEKTSVAVRKT